MNNDFEKSFLKVMELEGGFTLHKNQTESDVTYAGIYRKAHPKWEGWEYIDKKETPPTSLVRTFYYEKFYKQFNELDSQIAYLLFEATVNMGNTAIKLAQRALGLVDDGIIGPKTKNALLECNKDRFAFSFTIAKIAYYNNLAAKEQYRPYLRGWINRALKSVEGL